MKHINLTNFKGSITDWTELNYIKGGLADEYANIANLRLNDLYNYLDFENKKIIQNAIKYTFKGNETITKTSQVSDGGYRFNVILPFSINIDSDIKCNTLEYQTPTQMYNIGRAEYGIAVRNDTAVYIYIESLANGTTTDLRNWLINNTTTIIIQLAEPIEIDITQEPNIELNRVVLSIAKKSSETLEEDKPTMFDAVR